MAADTPQARTLTERAVLQRKIRQQRVQLRHLNAVVLRQQSSLSAALGREHFLRENYWKAVKQNYPLHQRFRVWRQSGWRWRLRCWLIPPSAALISAVYREGRADERNDHPARYQS